MPKFPFFDNLGFFVIIRLVYGIQRAGNLQRLAFGYMGIADSRNNGRVPQQFPCTFPLMGRATGWHKKPGWQEKTCVNTKSGVYYRKYRHKEGKIPFIGELCRKEEGCMSAEKGLAKVDRAYKYILTMNIMGVPPEAIAKL